MDWYSIINDLNAGTIGGMAGIIAGHPLDTIKVRLQAEVGLAKSNIKTTFRSIVSTEGGRAFYKGMLPPLIANAPINATLFATYGHSLREIENLTFLHRSSSCEIKPIHHAAAGMLAGLFQTIFSTPSEKVKIVLQLNKKTSSYNTTAWKTAISLAETHGIRRGLFHGWGITLARDVPSFGIYFFVYESLKNVLTRDTSTSYCWKSSMLAGGFAGSISWLTCLPLDVIKCRLQASSPSHNITDIWKTDISPAISRHGVKFLFKGLGPTLLRAFPVNAITFLVYEECLVLFPKLFI